MKNGECQNEETTVNPRSSLSIVHASLLRAALVVVLSGCHRRRPGRRRHPALLAGPRPRLRRDPRRAVRRRGGGDRRGRAARRPRRRATCCAPPRSGGGSSSIPCDTSRDAQVRAKIDAVIASMEQWTSREPRRADAWFFLGGAYGLRVQFRVLRGERLAAARDGKRIKDALERVARARPEPAGRVVRHRPLPLLRGHRADGAEDAALDARRFPAATRWRGCARCCARATAASCCAARRTSSCT